MVRGPTAQHVVLAAGTYGTQSLLFKMRDSGRLRISSKLGVLTRTNSESIVGAQTLKVNPDLDLTHGVAITSRSIPPATPTSSRAATARAPNAMGLLQTLMTDGTGPGGTDVPRWKQMVRNAVRHPIQASKVFIPRRWSERTVIALVMQNLDNSITTFTKRGIFGRRMTSKQGHGERIRPGFRWPTRPPTDRREDRRRGRGKLGRVVQHPDDGPLPRWRRHRGQPDTGVIDPTTGYGATRHCILSTGRRSRPTWA